MNEARFNRLSLAERGDMVWKHGEFVDSVICNNYCLMLYNLDDKFVELYLDLDSKNIVWISLANEYDLEKYLTHVHIEM